MSQKKEVNIAAIGAQYGLLAAIGCIALTLILYLIDASLVVGFWIYLGYAIIVLAKVLTAWSVRSAQGGVITFKEGLKGTFLVSVISLLIWTVFNAIMFTYIDSELVEMKKAKEIEQAEWWLDMADTPKDVKKKALQQAEIKDYAPRFNTESLNYAISLIIGFIYAAVISAIFYLVGKDIQRMPEET